MNYNYNEILLNIFKMNCTVCLDLLSSQLRLTVF